MTFGCLYDDFFLVYITVAFAFKFQNLSIKKSNLVVEYVGFI